MTREKAISWLKELTWHEGEDVPIYDTDVEAINMGIKALEQEPRWIPVTERIPEDKQRVIVTRKSGTVGYISWNTWWNEQTNYHNDKVIAWMPLPQPYNRESGG